MFQHSPTQLYVIQPPNICLFCHFKAVIYRRTPHLLPSACRALCFPPLEIHPHAALASFLSRIFLHLGCVLLSFKTVILLCRFFSIRLQPTQATFQVVDDSTSSTLPTSYPPLTSLPAPPATSPPPSPVDASVGDSSLVLSPGIIAGSVVGCVACKRNNLHLQPTSITMLAYNVSTHWCHPSVVAILFAGFVQRNR